LAVGFQRTQTPEVLTVPNDAHRHGWARACIGIGNQLSPLVGTVRGAGFVRGFLRDSVGQPRRSFEVWRGHEDFSFPATWRLLDLLPERVDVLHCHNLHGGYFDLRALAWLSGQVPLVLTLEDAWLFSGHCAHSFNCDRWQTGCGQCPDLTIGPAIRRDATAYNWQRKRAIYGRSRVYVATPSQWLMRRAEQSILAPAITEGRVIPHGVDLSIFCPADKPSVRAMLGLPSEAKIILFTANGVRRNIWKDYETMRAAIALAAERLHRQNLLFLALGDNSPAERIGRVEVRFVPYQTDSRVVARYCQAADVYVHAAKAEAWGLAITEALACGTPVVATAVGGIPEQVRALGASNASQATGVLVNLGDAEGMAAALDRLLSNDMLRHRLSENAAKDARTHFGRDRQAEAYLAWYHAILATKTDGAVGPLMSRLGR
jgi:glycosyltransferase involved in cell wall biosynthesis